MGRQLSSGVDLLLHVVDLLLVHYLLRLKTAEPIYGNERLGEDVDSSKRAGQGKHNREDRNNSSFSIEVGPLADTDPERQQKYKAPHVGPRRNVRRRHRGQPENGRDNERNRCRDSESDKEGPSVTPRFPIDCDGDREDGDYFEGDGKPARNDGSLCESKPESVPKRKHLDVVSRSVQKVMFS